MSAVHSMQAADATRGPPTLRPGAAPKGGGAVSPRAAARRQIASTVARKRLHSAREGDHKGSVTTALGGPSQVQRRHGPRAAAVLATAIQPPAGHSNAGCRPKAGASEGQPPAALVQPPASAPTPHCSWSPAALAFAEPMLP